MTQKTSNVLSGGLLDDIRPQMSAALPNTIGDSDDESGEDEEHRIGLAPVQDDVDDCVDWDDGDDDG